MNFSLWIPYLCAIKESLLLYDCPKFQGFLLFLNIWLSPPVQGVVTDPSPQTAAPSSQDASGQQPLPVENTGDHATAYSYQQTK